MTMSPHEVQAYVLTYLEALDCQIMERSPAHVTVKLSPEADKALTNRPYYWGFVERTGAPLRRCPLHLYSILTVISRSPKQQKPKLRKHHLRLYLTLLERMA